MSAPPSDPAPASPVPDPDALGPLGEVVRSAEGLLPHPVERIAERGPHELEPPHDLGPVARFDQAVDLAFDRLRGNPVADRIFYGATELGDFGLIWVLIGATRALGGDRHIRRATRLTATLAVESVVVNGFVKSLFKRERPVSQEPRPYKMRMPLTTSFPSGHASTAVVAAILLSEGSSLWPLYWGVAGVVATSRVYVRIHHASDVVGGLATGLVIGTAARAVWRRLAR
ncbi:MAG TPA: phosphatase PAP2 family protein [Acidimicrobiales bacterium]|nr:phosphatase PAP2 family protein [Acidimicrobiales bacterium]